MNGIFTTFTNSELTLLRGCLQIKPRMFLLLKPALCTFLTDWFSLGEYLLKHSEIWLCNDSSFSVLGEGNMNSRTVSKPGAGVAGREQPG